MFSLSVVVGENYRKVLSSSRTNLIIAAIAI